MSYKVNKIILLRDHKSFYLKQVFSMDEDFNLPYVAGDFQSIIPKEKTISSSLEKIELPLFNAASLLRIAEEAEKNTIVYLELDKNNWLKKIILDFDNIIPDLFYSQGSRLLYSFFNVSVKTPFSLTIQKENDQGLTYQKVKSNSTDPIFRQFFIKKALASNDKELNNNVMPELMTAAEVANYLQVQVKTIQNWTSTKTIPVEYAGGSPRYRKVTIDKWLNRKEI